MKIPVKISPMNSESFKIDYSDSESYALPYFQLRFFCPCASCIDEMSGKRILKESSIPKDIKPIAVIPVGQYALQVKWSDGHQTGLFHFDRIYDLCLKIGQSH